MLIPRNIYCKDWVSLLVLNFWIGNHMERKVSWSSKWWSLHVNFVKDEKLLRILERRFINWQQKVSISIKSMPDENLRKVRKHLNHRKVIMHMLIFILMNFNLSVLWFDQVFFIWLIYVVEINNTIIDVFVKEWKQISLFLLIINFIC